MIQPAPSTPPVRTPKDYLLDVAEFMARMSKCNEPLGYQLGLAEIDRLLSVAQPPPEPVPEPVPETTP